MNKIIIIISILFWFILIGLGIGAIREQRRLVKCVVGEAAGEGYEGMLAVALVFKNRMDNNIPFSDASCSCLKRKDINEFFDAQPPKVKENAYEIIRKVFKKNSLVVDITLGATHYANIERYGVPWWAKDMIITTKIGHHTFYKEVE